MYLYLPVPCMKGIVMWSVMVPAKTPRMMNVKTKRVCVGCWMTKLVVLFPPVSMVDKAGGLLYVLARLMTDVTVRSNIPTFSFELLSCSCMLGCVHVPSTYTVVGEIFVLRNIHV